MALTINVELDEAMSDHVRRRTGEDGPYATVEHYLIHLIQQDCDRRRGEFETVKAELAAAFAAPEDSYIRLTAQDVIDRNRGKNARAA